MPVGATGVHVAQPSGCVLLFQDREFSTQRSERKRFAGPLEMLALAVQRPIPDKPPRTHKLVKHLFLRSSRVQPVAIGCLDRSLHGTSIPDQTFYCKCFSALGRHIAGNVIRNPVG